MTHLKTDGVVIFLHTELETLRRRILNYETRGIAKRPEQSFDDLFRERNLLYAKYADITVSNDTNTQEEVCGEIIERLSTFAATHN
jgi:shikimate kinase